MKSPSLNLSTTRPSLNLSTTRSSCFQANKKEDWSNYHLMTLRKSIEDKSLINTKIRQELKLQKQTSKKVLSQIKSCMISTEENGIDFIARFEQQKLKHQYLQKLVLHYQQEIQKYKLKQYENTMQNIQNNEFDEQKNIQKQKEKQLEVITNRLNAWEFQKMTKYEKVKAERRERTVYSKQFNTLENQIFDLQYKYKQLVLERNLLQKEFEAQKDEFQKVQIEGKKKIKATQLKSEKMHDQWKLRKSDGLDLEDNTFYDTLMEPSFYRTRSKLCNFKMEKSGLNSRSHLYELDQKKLQNLKFMKHSQSLFNDLGVKSFKETKKLLEPNQYDLSKIQTANQLKMCQIQNLQDQIYDWKKSLQSLQLQKMRLCPKRELQKHQIEQIKRKKQLKKLIQQTNLGILQNNNQISQFKYADNLKDLKKLIKIGENVEEYHELKVHLQQAQNDLNHESHTQMIDLQMIKTIEQRFIQILGNLNDTNARSRAVNIRKSIFLEGPFTQNHERQTSNSITQKTICRLLDNSKINNYKRIKTAGSKQVNSHQGVKKLSNLLKNQSRTKGPTEIASKSQMIQQASDAFEKEGIHGIQRFEVRYE